MDDLVGSAREYAQEAHEGQNRKGKDIPYFAHVEQVARTLSNYGFRDEVVAAGYLHDVTEDVDEIGLSEIERRFGEDVAELVDGASEHDKSAPWRERKQHTIDYLRDGASPEEIALKASDKLDNVSSMREERAYQGEEFWEKFNATYEDQVWYHREVVAAMGERIEHGSFVNGSLSDLYGELKREVDQVFT